MTAVRGVLYEIGATHLPELLVLNKVDCADLHALAALRRAHPHALTVSAKTGEGLDELREAIPRELARLEAPDDGVAYPGEDQQQSGVSRSVGSPGDARPVTVTRRQRGSGSGGRTAESCAFVLLRGRGSCSW